VVDAGTDIVDLFHRHPDVAGELLSRALNAMAEADVVDRRCAADSPGDDRHWVDVIEQPCIGADLFHIVGNVKEHRDRAQSAHDPADAQRVGNRLAQTVLPGNVEIDHRRRTIPTDLEHRDHIICPIKCGTAVGGCLDDRVRAESQSESLGDNACRFQPLLVDIMQGDPRIGKLPISQDIAKQVLGKHRASCADKCDFGHRTPWSEAGSMSHQAQSLRSTSGRIRRSPRGLQRLRFLVSSW